MITISRLPAAEEHERCSSAAGRQKYIQATFLGVSVPAEQVFAACMIILLQGSCYDPVFRCVYRTGLLTIAVAILTGRPRRCHGSRSPCHTGWVSLVTTMTERNEEM